MKKTFNFKSNNNTTSTIFLNNKSTNYSKVLDDLIITDIINKNKYLFDYSKKNDGDLFESLIDNNTTFIGSNLKIDDAFIKATNFLANYKKNKSIPYIIGKMYTLSDGTPIVFYDDEIQIGFDFYSYSSFNDISFLNSLKPTTKNTIINIYINGNANINIL